MNNVKPPKEPTEKQKLGRIGEDCACDYLKKNGYKILDRNYLRKWGELDVVAQKGKKIHFVEVKSVSRATSSVALAKEDNGVGNVTHETSSRGEYRPEDNMHPWKLQRLGRAVQSYLLEKDIDDNIDWQFDVITVYIDTERRISRVFLIPDVVL
jgi:putative endonuclease